MNTPYLTPDLGEPWTVSPANPAAGADLLYTLPTIDTGAAVYLPLAVAFTFTCDANVANRQFRLRLEDATATALIIVSDANNLTAGQSARSCWNVGGLFANLAGAVDRSNVLTRMMLPNGYRVRTLMVNIQVGDQISNVQIHGLRWRTA